jgi:hypothetical protein
MLCFLTAISFFYKEYAGIGEEITVSGDRELPRCSQSEECKGPKLPTHYLQDSSLMTILPNACYSFLLYVVWKFKIVNYFYSFASALQGKF